MGERIYALTVNDMRTVRFVFACLLLTIPCMVETTANAEDSDVTELSPIIITPAPQHLVRMPGFFEFSTDLQIRCKEAEDPKQKNAISLLVEGIERSIGHKLQVKHDEGYNLVIQVEKAAPDNAPNVGEASNLLRAQGYIISVKPASIIIRGVDEPGLYYGIQTILQIIKNYKDKIPCMYIEDWPDMAFRGFGPVFGGYWWPYNVEKKGEYHTRDIDFYHDIAKFIAANKLNYITFETESDIFCNDDELRRFGRLCRANYIEPVPLHPFLCLAYRNQIVPYVEANDGRFQRIMKPAERAIELLQPKIFCIAADELVSDYDITKRKSIYTAEQLDRHPAHEWLLLCLLRFNEYFKSHGVQMVIWADSLINEEDFEGYPSAIFGYGGRGDYHYRVVERLPRDIILWDWQYTPALVYPTINYLQQKGFRTIGCPWHPNWNIALFSEYAHSTRTDKFLGMLCTDWWGPSHKKQLPARLEYLVSLEGIQRAGDCFWSPGKYARSYPQQQPYVYDKKKLMPLDEKFEAYKQLAGNNPLIDIPVGKHNISIKAQEPMNGRVLLARSIGLRSGIVRSDGLGARANRVLDVKYMLKAKQGCEFDGCFIKLELSQEFNGCISIAKGARGRQYKQIARFEGTNEKQIDATQLVKGESCFRIYIFGRNKSNEHATVLRGIHIDCEVSS